MEKSWMQYAWYKMCISPKWNLKLVAVTLTRTFINDNPFAL